MFGVPIHGSAKIYCDNESVVHNTTRPDSVLKKKHNSISYHKIRESVAAGIIEIFKIPSSENTLSGVQTAYHSRCLVTLLRLINTRILLVHYRNCFILFMIDRVYFDRTSSS